MNILHIVPLMSDAAAYGGPARGTMRQATATLSGQDRVHVLSLWAGAKPQGRTPAGVRVVTFKARRLPIPHRFVRLWSTAAVLWVFRAGRRYDVVHIHAGRELWVLVSMLCLRARGVPYVTQTHGMLAPRSSSLIRLYDSLLTRPAYVGASVSFYLTSYECRQLEDLGWASDLRLLVNGVDDPALKPVEESEPIAGMRVVTTARLEKRKHIPELVSAVARLRRRGVDIELGIFGPDEGDLSTIRQTIANEGAGGFITYGGALDYADVRPTLMKYNVYVLPSRREPFPNSLLEGLATGIASVCTRECGIAPYLLESGGGVVVEPGVDGLAEALTQLQDRATRVTTAQRGLNLVRTTFSMDAVAGVLRSTYEELAREHSA